MIFYMHFSPFGTRYIQAETLFFPAPDTGCPYSLPPPAFNHDLDEALSRQSNLLPPRFVFRWCFLCNPSTFFLRILGRFLFFSAIETTLTLGCSATFAFMYPVIFLAGPASYPFFPSPFRVSFSTIELISCAPDANLSFSQR